MPDILHELTIAAPPERVYQALTEQKELQSWWTQDAKAKPEVNSEAEFRFEGGMVVFKMRIDELENGKRVYWAAEASPVPGWENTRITWDLIPADEGTRLQFAHRDWPSTQGAFPSINYNWALYLNSLKSYVETGKGMPHASHS